MNELAFRFYYFTSFFIEEILSMGVIIYYSSDFPFVSKKEKFLSL